MEIPSEYNDKKETIIKGGTSFIFGLENNIHIIHYYTVHCIVEALLIIFDLLFHCLYDTYYPRTRK